MHYHLPVSRAITAIVLFFLCFCLMVNSRGEEWKSPHDLSLEENAPAALIPFPRELKWLPGENFKLPSGGKLAVSCSGGIDDSIVPALQKVFGAPAIIKAEKGRKGMLSLVLDNSLQTELGDEGYILGISKGKIGISAAGNAGLFYGIQTLRQLVKRAEDGSINIPGVEVKDKPAFPMRGFMHDCGRNYRTMEYLKKHLDEFARFKINTFHWHITDNPAWRVESKLYPQLNDVAHHMKGRDEGRFYTFDEIRELIAYAKKLHITIIPELDMPGHSAFFKPTFGFAMNSPEGMNVLEKLIDEFCREIPQKDCPYLHIGTDEVHINNPDEFVNRMGKKVEENNRIMLQWKPGLKIRKDAIAQLWSEGDLVKRPDDKTARFVDSSMGYVNVLDHPYLAVHRYFFKQLGGAPAADGQSVGGILCLWPDARVADKANVERHSPQWPGLLAFAERIWKGLPVDGKQYNSALPEKGTEARKAFELFEKRLLAYSRDFFFPYWSHTGFSWQVSPFVNSEKTDEVEKTRQAVLSGSPDLVMKTIDGAALMLRPRSKGDGLFPRRNPGVTVWAKMELIAPKNGDQKFMIGFDSPARSSRKWSGIPQNGEWSVKGTRIWVNGREIRGPVWKQPGAHFHKKDTWFDPANEIPFTDEEIWWSKEPAALPLKKGKNTIIVEHPYEGAWQSWNIVLIPVKKAKSGWVNDFSIKPGGKK